MHNETNPSGHGKNMDTIFWSRMLRGNRPKKEKQQGRALSYSPSCCAGSGVRLPVEEADPGGYASDKMQNPTKTKNIPDKSAGFLGGRGHLGCWSAGFGGGLGGYPPQGKPPERVSAATCHVSPTQR